MLFLALLLQLPARQYGESIPMVNSIGSNFWANTAAATSFSFDSFERSQSSSQFFQALSQLTQPVSPVLTSLAERSRDNSNPILNAIRDSRNASQLHSIMAKMSVSNIRNSLMDIIASHHPATQRHSERVASIAQRIGRLLGFSSHQLEKLRLAAECHDLGKTSISVDTLDSPKALTSEQRAEIDKHPSEGKSIFDRLGLTKNSFYNEVASLASDHHNDELINDINNKSDYAQMVRVLAAADRLEALTSSERAYRAPMPLNEAIDMLSENPALKSIVALAKYDEEFNPFKGQFA